MIKKLNTEISIEFVIILSVCRNKHTNDFFIDLFMRILLMKFRQISTNDKKHAFKTKTNFDIKIYITYKKK